MGFGVWRGKIRLGVEAASHALPSPATICGNRLKQRPPCVGEFFPGWPGGGGVLGNTSRSGPTAA